jgi:hypothetical protein
MLRGSPPAACPTGTVGRAGAARRCTKRHRRLWAQPGPWAVHGPRELRVDACTSRHRRPRDPSGTAGRERAGGAARLGADQVIDDSTFYSELALLFSELGVVIRILPFELWP